MTLLPAGYNPNGVAPVIYIYDQNLRLRYTYQHPQIIDPPQQDFVLRAWSISGGINANAGLCGIVIEDHNADMTDTQGSLIIRPGWHIQILLGKDAAGLESWFFGIVTEPQVERPGHLQQIIRLTAFGYAHTLSSRFVTVKHEQARDEASGEVDSTDMSACVSELVKLVFHEDSLLIPPADPNLTLNSIDPIDVKLANLDKVNQSQGIVLSELANVVNAVYGVTPDLDFYFHTVNKHSGFIATNGDATNIDIDKYMIIRNMPATYKDTIVRKAFTSLIGLNLTLQLDALADMGGTSERGMNQGSVFDAFGLLIPYAAPITELYIRVKRTASLSSMAWQVREGGDETSLSESLGTQITSGTISGTDLNRLPINNEAYLIVPVNVPAATGSPRVIWFTNQSNNLKILYDNDGTDGIYERSFSSSTAYPQYGAPRFRALGDPRQTLLKAQNLAIQRQQQHKEQVQYLSGTPQSETATALFEGLMDQAGQIRRIFSLVASVPNTQPPLGQQIKIIDSHNGLDTDALLIGYDIQGERRGKLTAIDISLELERYT